MIQCHSFESLSTDARFNKDRKDEVLHEKGLEVKFNYTVIYYLLIFRASVFKHCNTTAEINKLL